MGKLVASAQVPSNKACEVDMQARERGKGGGIKKECERHGGCSYEFFCSTGQPRDPYVNHLS